jgi:predicted ester cyclase
MMFLDHETSVGSEEEEEVPVSSAEENKVLMRRFLEAQANADPEDALEELLAPDFVDHSLQPDQEPGRDGFIRSVAEEPAIFSNLRANIDDQLAEGDKVTTRFTWRRIHDRGEFLGLAPTGMEIKTTAIVINRVSGGKITEEWSESTGVLEATCQRLEQERIERERIEQELQVARSIQQASLPKEVPSLQGWQINPYYHPAREVGGDFYDFHLLSEDRLGVVVGDATGKGVPAALVMASARSMLRALAQASNSPGEVLRRVNDALVTDIPPTCSSPASTPSWSPRAAP